VGVDYIIASDTDSVYINCEAIVKKVNLDSKEKIVNFLHSFGEKKLEPFIKKCFDDHANNMNAYKSALHMKREAIAERAVWRAKKNYIMAVWDSEGFRYDKPDIKTSGVESVRSSTPKVCRESLEKAYEILMFGTEDDMIIFIDNFKKVYYTLPFVDIAKPSSVTELSKFIDDKTGTHRKGAPMHVKAALAYNDAIIKHKLTKKYPLISDKDKIKFCEMKIPNPTFSPVFAISKEFPTELNLAKYIDYNKQFEKTFLSPVRSFLDIVGWNTEHVFTLDQFE
jgi:DNA polymerase elongation subunit (family B)